MKKHKHKKLLIALPILVVIIIVAGAIIFNLKMKEPPIVLENVGVDLEQMNYDQDAINQSNNGDMKAFSIFGDIIPKNDNSQNPNFDFRSLKEGVKVISAIDGVVVSVMNQSDSGDSEVWVRPTKYSIWTISYDHLTNLQVKKGDKVKVGQVLGSPFNTGNGSAWFEFQVNKGFVFNTKHICPTTLLGANKDTITAQLTSTMNKWEQLTGKDLYDEAKQNPIGCIKQTLSPADAEGN